jgi:hypothetical protein
MIVNMVQTKEMIFHRSNHKLTIFAIEMITIQRVAAVVTHAEGCSTRSIDGP